MCLKSFLQNGGSVGLLVSGKDNLTQSKKMRFVASVRVTVNYKDVQLAYIRGNLKEFTESGNCILDLNNSDDAQYPNSGIGKEIAELINTASIANIRNKIGADGITNITIGHDGHNFTFKKTDRTTTNLELSEMAKGLVDFGAEVAEHRKPKEETKMPQSSDAAKLLDKAIGK